MAETSTVDPTARAPRLSVGLPVYNGERYLAAALGSLLDQDYTDFELIVCDNASDDRTEEICRAFAAADPRIRYVRQDRNLGAAANYNHCVALARGEYFKWAAHDDVCAPTFLSACVRTLDEDAAVVLCHSASLRIDAAGRSVGSYPDEVDAMDKAPHRRFRRVIREPHYCIPVFGVMRLAVLKATPRHGDYVGADRNLLAELSLHGKVRLLPEPLFQRRDHAESSVSKYSDERQRLAWFDPRHEGRRSYPTWRRLREYAAAIGRAPLSTPERLRCLAELGGWLAGRHHTGAHNARLLLWELLK